MTVATLVVDSDGNIPRDVTVESTRRRSKRAPVSRSACGISVPTRTSPVNYMKAFKNIVWFTENITGADHTVRGSSCRRSWTTGGRLLMSGQDILDQAAGTTAFVQNYLHISWDGTRGSKRQGDR